MKKLTHIEKQPDDYSICTGCSSCEMMCSLFHEKSVGPCNNRIFIKQGPTQLQRWDVYTCQQCDDAPCYEACPLKDKAMCKDPTNGIVYINDKLCIGCGACQRACRFIPARINMVKSDDKKKRKARKCDLCRDRADGPACVEQCPAVCLYVKEAK